MVSIYGWFSGDMCADRGPELVYIWGLHGPDRLPNPSKKVEGEAEIGPSFAGKQAKVDEDGH